MRRAALSIAGCLLLALLAGCRSRGQGPPLADPALSERAEYDRAMAQQFDPYPQDEQGPQIVGGRPPDFQMPPAEPTRVRWLPWSTWGGGQ